ncbi:MAG TPA: GNAT family N-acetyltransferase [Candidatus Limnocylindrales bacterium]|nr:GNAT family N-acetyltransferase [Candidatus Limnocylindrales bacterium]
MKTMDRSAGSVRKAPDGLRLRPYAGESDIPTIANIINRELEHDGVPFRESEADIVAWYGHPNDKFDSARDVTIAEVDGVPVGFAQRSWIDTTLEEFREYRNDGGVLPEWQRRGIGTALLEYNIERSQALAATHETNRPRILGSWTADRMPGSQAILRAAGFEQVRWFFEMTRDLSLPIPEVPMPEGLEVREVTTDQIRQIWEADIEAFLDHWGGFDGSEDSYQRFLQKPAFDPSLWVIAWDGDEVAGGVVNAIETAENEMLGVKRGWLHSVFTRRAWRKRGLAHALITRSLVKIKERGMDQGILGVDASNPTGALGLYERNGFVVAERSTAWRRPLFEDQR